MLNRSSTFLSSPINPGTVSFVPGSDTTNLPQSIDSLDNVVKVFNISFLFSVVVSSIQFVQIISGSDHCYAVTLNKQVYTWGLNTLNRLGLLTNPEETIIRCPSLLNSLSDKVFLYYNNYHYILLEHQQHCHWQ